MNLVKIITKKISIILITLSINSMILFTLPVMNYLKKNKLYQRKDPKESTVKLEKINLKKEKKKEKKRVIKKIVKPKIVKSKKQSSSRFKLKLSSGGSGVSFEGKNVKDLIYSEGQVDQNPIAIRRIRPSYPQTAKASGVTGKVNLKITIGTLGEVQNIDILLEEPPGFGFKESAINAVWGWKFKPAMIKNIPVRCYRILPLIFN